MRVPCSPSAISTSTPTSLLAELRRLVDEALVLGGEPGLVTTDEPAGLQRGDGGLGQRAAVGVVEVADGRRPGPGLLGVAGRSPPACSESLGAVRKNSSDDGKSSRASDVAVGEHVRMPADEQLVERGQRDGRRGRPDDGVDVAVDQRADGVAGRRGVAALVEAGDDLDRLAEHAAGGVDRGRRPRWRRRSAAARSWPPRPTRAGAGRSAAHRRPARTATVVVVTAVARLVGGAVPSSSQAAPTTISATTPTAAARRDGRRTGT